MTLNLLVLLVSLIICMPTEAQISQQKEANFTFLLLAHFWPTTSCVFFHNEHKECYVPPEVTGWTIHGLWPSIEGEEKPNYCNNSMKFDFAQIKSLSPRLAVGWPFYQKDGEKTELWDHEWTKHGTCALSLPVLRGEFNFFNQTLNLHEKLNITKMLAKSGIVPSPKTMYKPTSIFEAVKSSTGLIPNIKCLKEEKTGDYHLEQIWLCYDKNLQLRDCPHVAFTRSHSSTLYFESKSEQGGSMSSNSYYQDCPGNDKTLVYYKPLPRNFK